MGLKHPSNHKEQSVFLQTRKKGLKLHKKLILKRGSKLNLKNYSSDFIQNRFGY